MIPTQEKVENHFTAECCYLALECKGIEQTEGVKIFIKAIFPDPLENEIKVVVQSKISKQAQEVYNLIEQCHQFPEKFDKMKRIIQKSKKQPVIVDKNIKLNPQFNIIEKERIKHLDNKLNQKQESAKTKADCLLSDKREKAIHGIGKWDEFRIKRDKVIREYCKFKKLLTRSKSQISLVIVIKVLVWLRNVWKSRLQARLRADRLQWSSFFIAIRFKRNMNKLFAGKSTVESRNQTRIRQSLSTIGGIILYKNSHLNSQQYIRTFFRDIKWRNDLAIILTDFSITVRYVQLKVRMKMSFLKFRMQYLRDYWVSEWNEYAEDCFNSSDVKEQEQCELMGEFNQSLVNKFLRLYLDRCILMHSLAFLQYRKVVSSFLKNKELEIQNLKELYLERQEFLLKLLKTIEVISADESFPPKKKRQSWQQEKKYKPPERPILQGKFGEIIAPKRIKPAYEDEFTIAADQPVKIALTPSEVDKQEAEAMALDQKMDGAVCQMPEESDESIEEFEDEEVTLERMLNKIMAKSTMDLSNKVKDLESFCMLPGVNRSIKTDFAAKKSRDFVNKHSYHENVYPKMVAYLAEKQKSPPKCIFLPDRPLIRFIMKLLIKHEQGYDDDEDFLIKFGLVNKLEKIMNAQEDYARTSSQMTV